ncbi:MAG: hypothetical protein OEV64_04965 [Desulfobulbaceae bacterium]|nr:hypothetical protein [Desulfobulbaceae bacterium]
MEKILVKVDEDLLDLIDGYLKTQHDEAIKMKNALAGQDYEVIRIAGHCMKGTGAGYGFTDLTDIGGQLEHAGEKKDGIKISHLISKLENYLARVEVEYVPEEDL